MRSRRISTALAGLIPILAGACGTVGAVETAPTSTLAPATTVAPTTTSTSTSTTTTSTIPATTTTEAQEVFETVVLVAKPEVTRPETFDAPDGNRVTFRDAVTNPTYFGTDLALLVTEGEVGDEWLKVQLPTRPNGTEAWVRAEHYVVETHSYHAELDVSDRHLKVWNGDELLLETGTVVGAPATPTPIGRFYVNDLVPKDNPNGAFGPWILSLSAHSETLETFSGGRPVIAVHGTNQPGLVGENVSNGCIRIPNDMVEVLAKMVPLGTPVDISA